MESHVSLVFNVQNAFGHLVYLREKSGRTRSVLGSNLTFKKSGSV